MIDTATGEEIGRVTSDDNNEHTFALDQDRNYTLIAGARIIFLIQSIFLQLVWILREDY
ncbi:MAG: hypothetical protein R2774_12490 [Saprospiraceae bacterium]